MHNTLNEQGQMLLLNKELCMAFTYKGQFLERAEGVLSPGSQVLCRIGPEVYSLKCMENG